MFRLALIPLFAFTTALSAGATQSPDIAAMQKQAIQFLKVTQGADGSWTKNDVVGVTGLVTTSLLQSGLTADDPAVSAGLANLMSHVKTDGGIYAKGSLHRNYETCITVYPL